MAAVGTFAAQGPGHEAVDSGCSGGTVEAPSDRLKGMQMMSLETASGMRCVACPISADSSTGTGSLADVVLGRCYLRLNRSFAGGESVW
jgi:hypothetical protein